MIRKVHLYGAYSKQSQVIKFQRQRGFHIPDLKKFLRVTYRRLQRHPLIASPYKKYAVNKSGIY